MNTLPSISLVMPSYNQARYLETAICSVLDQHYPNLEFILMDGGSSDASPDIIRRYADRLSYWQSAPDKGQADALKHGFARTSGELLGWLNSDDVLLPGTLAHIASAYINHPECGLFAGNLLWIDPEDRIIRCKRHPSSAKFFIHRGVYALSQPGSFFKRADYLAVGGVNTGLRYVMDADLYIRMLDRGVRHYHINDWTAAFRLQELSKTVAESAGFNTEFEHTRVRDWPNVKPGRAWRILYKAWQVANGNYIRMASETLLARGKKWQDWVKFQ